MKNNLKVIIKRVGKKYKESPKSLKVIVGQVLDGTIKLKK